MVVHTFYSSGWHICVYKTLSRFGETITYSTSPKEEVSHEEGLSCKDYYLLNYSFLPICYFLLFLLNPDHLLAAPVLNAPVAILDSHFSAPGTLDGNGIKTEAVGSMKRVGEEDVVTMKGSYEFVGDDGEIYVVTWYADETGFHPSAPHIPNIL
ncbi:Uncharacterized protein FKW44_008187 [Caligus rogercresseyi]|uniref:Uncharacterized protein n=1 Tax=Caligus rogercresseyi TaxID=217165 RepID=A0A7T8KFT4_CALRO|nr:Uncharacterized protein FKW44_008187 [Caligus rogercresseyi]